MPGVCMLTTQVERSGATGPAVDSPEFWAAVERTPVPSDPDAATAQVVRRICQLASTSVSDPILRGYAVQAVRQFRGGPLWAAAGLDPFNVAPGDGRREAMIAESVWWWAKLYLRFKHHSEMIWDRLRERDQWQLLISPDVLVRMWPMKGDCAVYSTLIPAMLSVLGVPWELETVAADADQPSVYSHVFVRAILPDGVRVPLDASHGGYAGWRVPAHDTFRSQVWDSSGRPVPDVATFRGLGVYGMRRGLGGAGRRGMGDGGESDPNVTTLADPFGLFAQYESPSLPATRYPPVPGADPRSWAPAGTDWGGVFSGLLSDWTKIGSKVLAPEVSYSRGPNGQLVYSAPAGSGSSFGLPSIGGADSHSWLLIGGAGLAVVALVFAFKSKGGR